MAALEDLVVSGEELDREALAGLLGPLVRLNKDRPGAIIPQDPWSRMSNDGRILTYLLARKAMCAVSLLPEEAEAATPADVEQATGLPGGSVRPGLRRLVEQRLVREPAPHQYSVPNLALGRARTFLRRWIGG
jgi:hypothetical protein